MTNRGVSTARLLPAGVQGACTFVMARHLFLHRRLIDQFLMSRVAVFKGGILRDPQSTSTLAVNTVETIIERRRWLPQRAPLGVPRCVIPADAGMKNGTMLRRGRCCNKEIITLVPFGNQPHTLYHAVSNDFRWIIYTID